MPKHPQLVRHYFILPCCLLLLNLANAIVSYKAAVISDPVIRVLVIMLLVLGGSSVVAFLVAPAIESLVGGLHQRSRQQGAFGEVLFICVLALAVFWLYFQVYIHGVASILPAEWVNPRT